MSEMIDMVAKGWNSITDRWFVRLNKMHNSQQWEVVHDWGVNVISENTMKVISRHHLMVDAKADAKGLEDAARARAAIAAMREPTQEIYLAGRELAHSGDEDKLMDRDSVKERWRVMIDAALKCE